MISNTTEREPPWDELDPGIRETVRALWLAGFMTTDSGDGMSKPAEFRTLGDRPHVIIRVMDTSSIVAETTRLERVLWRHRIGLVGTECTAGRETGHAGHAEGPRIQDTIPGPARTPSGPPRRACIHCGREINADTGEFLSDRVARVAEIEAGYNPADGVAVIVLSGVDDRFLLQYTRQRMMRHMGNSVDAEFMDRDDALEEIDRLIASARQP